MKGSMPGRSMSYLRKQMKGHVTGVKKAHGNWVRSVQDLMSHFKYSAVKPKGNMKLLDHKHRGDITSFIF